MRKKGKRILGYAYECQAALFSPAERSFMGVLMQAVGDDAWVFGKVRIADVIKPAKRLSRSEWQLAFNKISAKHFDFVICDKATLAVIAAVELDDRSHENRQRVERDQLVNNACASAGLVLHRIPASNTYSVTQIRDLIFATQTAGSPSSNQSSDQPDSKPVSIDVGAEGSALCPKCSSPLVTRTARKGHNKGSKFKACSAFPECRYTETLTS